MTNLGIGSAGRTDHPGNFQKRNLLLRLPTGCLCPGKDPGRRGTGFHKNVIPGGYSLLASHVKYPDKNYKRLK